MRNNKISPQVTSFSPVNAPVQEETPIVFQPQPMHVHISNVQPNKNIQDNVPTKLNQPEIIQPNRSQPMAIQPLVQSKSLYKTIF